jgi:hypothetical protein
VSHIAEANPGYTELAEKAARTPIDGVASPNTYWRSVAWELLQTYASRFTGLVSACRVNQGLLELKTLGCISRNHNLSLLVSGNLALLRH